MILYPIILAHLDGHEYLPNGSRSCAPFWKGHSKDYHRAISQKGAQECHSWRTTMSPCEGSCDGSVLGSGVGTSDVFYWESILASFIANSSAALVHPYFYLIRTNTRWSLCQLSGLSPINYCALLLECQLVQARTNLSDGSRFVRFERKKWIAI